MPPFDISDLRATIVPKSDQLNSEQLLSGPMTVTVTDVSIGSDDQPLIIHHDKDKQRPFKPCKTMRKLLIFAWGEDGRKWPGQSMTLFNDPNVRFGGAEVGGIRISHMTGIERTVQISLTATKGKKALHTVQPLKIAAPSDSLGNAIDKAQNIEQCKSAFETAYKSTRDAAARASFKSRYDARMAALKKQDAEPVDPVALGSAIELCTTIAELDAEAKKLMHVTDDADRSLLTDQVMAKREQLESST